MFIVDKILDFLIARKKKQIEKLKQEIIHDNWHLQMLKDKHKDILHSQK